MKSCPTCNRSYTDASLNFCLEDGTPLVQSAAPGFDPNATIRYDDPRDTKSPPPPPPPEVRPTAPPTYQPTPVVSQPPTFAPTPPSMMTAPGARGKKTSVVWWVLGGALVLAVIVVGVAVMIFALASMGSNSNANANRANANSRIPNRNANTPPANVANVNASPALPSSFTDDFSEAKWGTGNYDFGEIWYADNQYHLRSKEKTYLVMYAPNNDYKTGNATVRVTARSVDGTSPTSGYGLIVHGEKSKTGQLEDYALLIYTGTDPQYEIVKHKGGTQATIKPWAKSKVIRSGTNPNQLEVRARGSELSFYINGQYVDRITDTENFKGGVAGLYTSDTAEIVFDDLEIKR